MRDHEARVTLPQPLHRVPDLHLGAAVNGTRRLVQHQDAAPRELRPCDRDELALAPAQGVAVVAEHGGVAGRQGPDELVHVAGPGRRDDVGVGGPGPAVLDVLPDAAGEQPGVLQDGAEDGPQLVPRDAGDVGRVHQDPPGVELVEAHQEVHHGGLAGPGVSHDCHGLSRLHREGEVLHHGGAGAVTEAHVLEGDAARHRAKIGRDMAPRPSGICARWVICVRPGICAGHWI